jgi:hypothetical protein
MGFVRRRVDGGQPAPDGHGFPGRDVCFVHPVGLPQVNPQIAQGRGELRFVRRTVLGGQPPLDGEDFLPDLQRLAPVPGP